MSEQFINTLKEWTEAFMHRSMRSFLAYAKDNGLSVSQFGALGYISRGSDGVSGIGEDLGISSAAASQMLERLVQQGLILRSEDPHDRRVKQIVLTDKGEKLLRGSWQARQGWFEELEDALTPAEQKQIATALTILTDKIRQLESQPELK